VNNLKSPNSQPTQKDQERLGAPTITGRGRLGARRTTMGASLARHATMLVAVAVLAIGGIGPVAATPAAAQQAQAVAVFGGAQVLDLRVFRTSYMNTESTLRGGYEGSTWVFLADGTFLFTPGPGMTNQRVGSWSQSADGIYFYAVGGSANSVGSATSAMQGLIRNQDGALVAVLEDATAGSQGVSIRVTNPPTSLESSGGRYAQLAVTLAPLQ
jgi:hypothetical protein